MVANYYEINVGIVENQWIWEMGYVGAYCIVWKKFKKRERNGNFETKSAAELR